jgi:hypothetical protein
MPLESARSLWQSRPMPDAAAPLTTSTTARPLRLLELITGERLYVEWLSADRECAEFRWRGRNRFRLQWWKIASLANPPGVVDVLDESFEDAALGEITRSAHSGRFSRRCAAGTPPWRWKAPTPIPSGRVRWCQRVESFDTRGHEEIVLEFAPKPGLSEGPAALEITAPEGSRDREAGPSESPGFFAVHAPAGWSTDFRQPVRMRAGWHEVAVEWDRGDWRILLGEAVLARGRGATEGLSAVQWGPATDELVVWFDDVSLQRLDATVSRAPSQDEALDAVTLHTGDVLYGKIDRADATGWRLRGPRGTVDIPWTEWSALHRAVQRGEAVASALAYGSVRRMELSPPLWPRGLSRETLIAAAISRHDGLTEWDHPLLGRLLIEPVEIAAQTERHRGGFGWLEPRRIHLGDELRSEFASSQPAGHAVTGTFQLATPPRGRCFIALDAAELEPSGPQTPPTQPYLSALRGGALRTELFVNGQLIGDWNRQLSWRPRISQPERLRMELPWALLHAGENRWEIRQQSLSPGDDRYDDCELGRIALEIAP